MRYNISTSLHQPRSLPPSSLHSSLPPAFRSSLNLSLPPFLPQSIPPSYPPSLRPSLHPSSLSLSSIFLILFRITNLHQTHNMEISQLQSHLTEERRKNTSLEETLLKYKHNTSDMTINIEESNNDENSTDEIEDTGKRRSCFK